MATADELLATEAAETGKVHVHGIYDSDAHYIIDPTTREIKVEHSLKKNIAKHDHNSEVITFELPKTVDGHDMLLCNQVWVHYINIDAKTKKEYRGIFEVKDLQTSKTDDGTAVCSWTITRNSTQVAGVLSFSIRFACIDENGVEVYGWGTANYESLSVSDRNHNSEVIAEEYADILEQWRQDLFAGKGNNAGSVCDCVISVNPRPPLAGVNCAFSVVSGSLMSVWEKANQGAAPKVLLQYLGEHEGDFFNYFAESVSVEHFGWNANGGTAAEYPESLTISFVLGSELIVLRSTSGTAISGNIISTYAAAKLGEAATGSGSRVTIEDETLVFENGSSAVVENETLIL